MPPQAAAILTLFLCVAGFAVFALVMYFVIRTAVTDGMKAYAKWRDEGARPSAAE